MFRLEERGPVAKYGLRRRPSEPENVGSNPTGPAHHLSLNPVFRPFKGLNEIFEAYS